VRNSMAFKKKLMFKNKLTVEKILDFLENHHPTISTHVEMECDGTWILICSPHTQKLIIKFLKTI